MPLDPPLSADDHVRGPLDATHVLVAYEDFECPFCQAAQSVLERVRTRMGGELRFAFRHFPLDELHPHARMAAEAAEAAAAQGRFWEGHDALFGLRGRLERREILEALKAAGLDADRIAAELDAGTHAERVEADRRSGIRSGVPGTPAFFADGRLITGAFDAGSIVEALRGGG